MESLCLEHDSIGVCLASRVSIFGSGVFTSYLRNVGSLGTSLHESCYVKNLKIRIY